MDLTQDAKQEDTTMQQQTATSRKPWVRHGMSAHTVNVESQSTSGTFYTVNVRTGQCSCPAGKHGRICWHVSTAQAFMAMRVVESAPVSTPPAAPSFHETAGYKALADAFA